jgi:photosynthetic reaction center cytochrome c subunit
MRQTPAPSVRPALLAIGILVATVLLAALGTAQEGMSRQSMKGKTAAQQFKNIKVLKKLPADQLLPLMRTVSTSLGTNCGFCHDRAGFQLDTKPEKNVARQMIVMTQSLNAHQKILAGKATCYMCHHGRPTPETRVQALGPGGPPSGGGPPPAP